ncbi:hypothetical protein SLEP1_g51095 [Rubroshorea leprosula]|uniref:Uncharacterized protein n=1 Tax=Rubroshorea leprosula TaxID=152421 RepID=A0AAV5M300_9ROSI|nr:hypothetical protein SLEP1_g51095 [Rubroshorea leprosula]
MGNSWRRDWKRKIVGSGRLVTVVADFPNLSLLPADGNDWVLCFGWRRRRGLNSSQKLMCRSSASSVENTEVANLTALVAFPDGEDVGRSAFLNKAVAITFDELDFSERSDFS